VIENRDSRLPTGLAWLLIYQWILVLVVVVSLGFSTATVLQEWKSGITLIQSDSFVFFVFSVEFLVLACWGTAMGFASVGMVRRPPQRSLLGMICHLLITIPVLTAQAGSGLLLMTSDVGTSVEPRWWVKVLPAFYALMWLPSALISAWGFFYLRRLRKRLFS